MNFYITSVDDHGNCTVYRQNSKPATVVAEAIINDATPSGAVLKWLASRFNRNAIIIKECPEGVGKWTVNYSLDGYKR